MGKLIYANETSFSHAKEDGVNEITLQNWRAAKEVKDYRMYNGNITTGLLVILESFRCYFIPDFTFDMLRHENSFDNKLDIPYEYVRNVLSCTRCYGSGKLDWINNVMGKKSADHIIYKTAVIEFNTSGYIKIDNPNESLYYLGIPYLNKGAEICKDCNGSGIHRRSLLWLSKLETNS